MKIGIKINWKDYDSKGNLISETEHEANSIVKPFIAILLAQLANVTISNPCKDTGNTTRNTAPTTIFTAQATTTTTTHGIIVGTGTTAVTIDDYNVETPIAHGNGAGQLAYGAVNFDTGLTADGSNSYYFYCSRTFANNSGGNITIGNVGLVVRSTYNFLIDHTLSSKTINNGASSTCTYKISITV